MNPLFTLALVIIVSVVGIYFLIRNSYNEANPPKKHTKKSSSSWSQS